MHKIRICRFCTPTRLMSYFPSLSNPLSDTPKLCRDRPISHSICVNLISNDRPDPNGVLTAIPVLSTHSFVSLFSGQLSWSWVTSVCSKPLGLHIGVEHGVCPSLVGGCFSFFIHLIPSFLTVLILDWFLHCTVDRA